MYQPHIDYDTKLENKSKFFSTSFDHASLNFLIMGYFYIIFFFKTCYVLTKSLMTLSFYSCFYTFYRLVLHFDLLKMIGFPLIFRKN